jgi:hypothetical protein
MRSGSRASTMSPDSSRSVLPILSNVRFVLMLLILLCDNITPGGLGGSPVLGGFAFPIKQ